MPVPSLRAAQPAVQAVDHGVHRSLSIRVRQKRCELSTRRIANPESSLHFDYRDGSNSLYVNQPWLKGDIDFRQFKAHRALQLDQAFPNNGAKGANGSGVQRHL